MSKRVHILMAGVGCALIFSSSCKNMMSDSPFPKQFLGSVKSDTTLADLQAHPIWLWGLQVNEPEDVDGVSGSDETGMRAWLGPSNVTREMCRPEILLRVKGTNLWAVGQYDRDHKLLDALGVFGTDGRRPASWYIQTPGVPITYIAVPSIEGQHNVEFVAKNRQRWQALMVGEFTPAEAERRYEEEISENRVSASSPATLIRKNPELLKLVVPFVKRVAQDNLAESRGLVFTDVAGWLEDEDPGLFERLITDATTQLIVYRGCSRAVEEGEFWVTKATGEKGILLVVTRWRKEGDGYSVHGYWSKNSAEMHNVRHQVSKVDGIWVVND